MSKVAIKGNASGTGTFTLEAPNSNTDRTLVLPDEAGTVITSGSYVAGITEVDLWRLITNVTANDETIANTKVERSDDASFGKIGTGMSVNGSGYWTFPVTGVWQVTVQAFLVPAAGDTSVLRTDVSQDSGSNWDQVAWATGGDMDGQKGTFYSQAFVNVTNTSTVLVKFTTASFAAGTQLQSDTNVGLTSFSFIRMGDAV